MTSKSSENAPRDLAQLATWALAGAAAGLLLRHASRPQGNARVPQPERAVDLTRYLGKWYELARYDNWFEHRCDGVTAEYGLLPDGRISVRNSCQKNFPNGRLSVAKGKGKAVPGSGNAKLKISFFGPFYIGNYWVLDRAEDYGWSIVGERSGHYLWILCRDPHPPEWLTQMLLRRATEMGYDPNRIRRTRQAG